MSSQKYDSISRREFIKMSGALTTGSTIGASILSNNVNAQTQDEKTTLITKFKRLGRTGFDSSDIGMGGTRVTDANVYRYAYDHGVNYFDTAESYHRGDSERKLGEALKFMERKKVFITTKLHLDEDESEDSILKRFGDCCDRLQTEYVDCLDMHKVIKVSLLDKPEFHSAVAKLKADGKLKFAGISSHGPRRDDQDSMEKVLTAAASDGRFDVMLLVYNFMNKEAGNRIIKACKENNVGATAMKTAPGVLKADAYDPANPTEAQSRYLKRLQRRYDSEDKIQERMQGWVQRQKEIYEKSLQFISKYGMQSEMQLRIDSIRWVMQNPDMHTACVSFADFDFIDSIIPFSGKELSTKETGYLDIMKELYDDQYCRHGCNSCIPACPHHLPVSTIMRYAYYFEHQGREKEAIIKYKNLSKTNGSLCKNCDEPCLSACAYSVDIPAQLRMAHQKLALV